MQLDFGGHDMTRTDPTVIRKQKEIMKTISSILAFGLLSGFTVSAQTVSLVATAPVAGIGLSAPLAVQTNQVVKLLHAFMPPEANPSGDQTRTPIVDVTINTNTFEYVYVRGLDLVVAGPATIRLKVKNTNTFFQDSSSVYATFQIADNQPQFSPSTAVVIPADATGPVNIVLESSPDLLNWTGALPGTYGASTTKRFFRVRAVRQ